MRTRRLKINDEFTYYGVKHTVYDVYPPKVVIQRIGLDNKVYEIDYLTLVTDVNFIIGDSVVDNVKKEIKKSNKAHISFLDTLSEIERDKVTSKFDIIRPILLYEKIKSGDLISIDIFKEKYSELLKEGENLLQISKEELLKRVSLKCNKSTRQLKRYISLYKNEENNLNNGLTGLIRKSLTCKIIRKDERAIQICHPKNPEIILDVIYSRLDEKYDEIIKEAIEKHYLKKRKISIANLHNVIEILCHDKNLKPIDYNTIYYLITKRLNPRIKDIYRNGNKEDYEETLRGFSNQFAKAPLHVVEIDHTKLDVDVIDEKSGVNLGRPWITIGIDVYTRMIWCMHISFDEPSADKVRKAIEHGLFFKRIKNKYNTLNEWEISGIPKIIYFDNGSEFKNAAVKRMVEETLESQVMYRPVATPRYGGVIERFFGTINKKLIHKLAGTRKSNPTQLGDYDAEKEAIFTLEDIKEILTTYIVDVYHHEVHKGLPHEYPTPTAMYYHGIEVRGYPDFISQEDEDYYRIELLPVDWREYSKDGIRKENVFYGSQETSKLINKQKIKYKIKYDIDDISKIYVLDPTNHCYIEAPARNPSAEDLVGMSLQTYKLIIKELRERGEINKNQIPGSKEIVKARAWLAKKINKMMKRNKNARQKALKAGFSITSALSEKVPIVGQTLNRLEVLKNKVNAQQKKKAGESIE